MTKPPLTLRRIPSLERLILMKRRACRSGRHLRILLCEERDFGGRPPASVYDVRSHEGVVIAHRADEIAVRTKGGDIVVMKNRYQPLLKTNPTP